MKVKAHDTCLNCARPLELVEGVGWLHGELPQHANDPFTCEQARPSSVRVTDWAPS